MCLRVKRRLQNALKFLQAGMDWAVLSAENSLNIPRREDQGLLESKRPRGL